jgi:hypothetical protein
VAAAGAWAAEEVAAAAVFVEVAAVVGKQRVAVLPLCNLRVLCVSVAGLN